MSRLDQIYIYPIKSCAGISLDSAIVEDRGFPLDRRWMLIEENGDFISQRSTPKLGQIRIDSESDNLHINYAGKRELTVAFDTSPTKKLVAQIWKDKVEGNWVNEQSDGWFSELLGRPVHLIHMNKHVSRPLLKPQLPQDQDFEVSFADGYPYLLTNQSSLDDLNHRLDDPVGMDRFRSNLVVSGFEAFAEDGWKKIKIGEVEFLCVKPCARCQVTTLDQKTGKASKEPLKTLATYRKQDGKVMFGINMVALNTGTVQINDPVSIL